MNDLLRKVVAERIFGSRKPGESGISHFQSGNRQEHPQTSGEAEGSILKESLEGLSAALKEVATFSDGVSRTKSARPSLRAKTSASRKGSGRVTGLVVW